MELRIRTRIRRVSVAVLAGVGVGVGLLIGSFAIPIPAWRTGEQPAPPLDVVEGEPIRIGQLVDANRVARLPFIGAAPSYRIATVFPTLEAMREARARVAPVIRHTPLVPLHEGFGATRIFLKLETFQPVGSFKIRGVLNAVSRLTEAERA